MNIGLIDIEPKVFNTAYMQISRYHKDRGDTVGWWSPLTDSQFDVVYCSSLFDFTDKSEVPKHAICGGTGFDVTSQLSKEMEECDCDYSLYPECDHSIVWFSRGCVRQCPFCVVHWKEGKLYPVKPKNLNPNGKYIVVQDNNFFANPLWKDAVQQIHDWGLPIDMQGVDVRTMNDEKFGALDCLPRWNNKQIKVAWDDPKDEGMFSHLKFMTRFIKPYKIMCYVLIGYDSTPEQDLMRVRIINELGIDPFVMPYNKTDPYQKNFARWVNRKEIFKTVRWEDYKYSVSSANSG